MNSFTDIMFEGAILPSRFCTKDPRYFYKGTGTTKASVAHVLYSLIATKEITVNGAAEPVGPWWQSGLCYAISNAYYPTADMAV